VKHFRKKLDLGRLVRILFREFESQFESAILPWSVIGTTYVADVRETKKKKHLRDVSSRRTQI
jgi:hypothetical protein